YGKRLDEVRHRRQRRAIEALERDIDGGVFHLGFIENVLEANAGPFGVADRAVAPLPAGHARIELAAGIARALANRDARNRLELLAKIIDREAQRRIDMPPHRQAKLIQIDG